MLQPLLFILIPRFQIRVQIGEILECGDAAGVVGCYRGAFEALAEDFVAGAEAGGVVG